MMVNSVGQGGGVEDEAHVARPLLVGRLSRAVEASMENEDGEE